MGASWEALGHFLGRLGALLESMSGGTSWEHLGFVLAKTSLKISFLGLVLCNHRTAGSTGRKQASSVDCFTVHSAVVEHRTMCEAIRDVEQTSSRASGGAVSAGIGSLPCLRQG